MGAKHLYFQERYEPIGGGRTTATQDGIRKIITPVCTMRVLVDAVCIRVLCKEKLLVGIGNQLLLVHLSPTGETIRTFAPLPRLVDKIHGIERWPVGDDEYLVAFHAGREAYSVTLDCKTHTFSECVRIVIPEETCLHPVPYVRRRVNDWISCMSLLSATELCLVTSHGVAVRLQRNKGKDAPLWTLAEKCACEDGSTLYCSSLTGQKWEQVVCFSGTALGLLLVWRVSGSNENGGKVLRSISAHNGVIFSIACDIGSGLLTTTSDDRSVKFWKIELPQSKTNDTVVLREERYCFAHTARVFQCRIITKANHTVIASIGEDAHLCLWNTEGDLQFKKRLDDGPTLWGMDYDDETATIFVTASNGNLHKYCIQRWMEEDSCSGGLDRPDMLDISPKLPSNEHLAKARFTSNGSVIAVTNTNHVMMVDNAGTHIQTLDRIEQFKCSIVEVGGCYLYLAGGRCIYLYEVTAEGFKCVVTSKVISFTDKAFHSDGEELSIEGIIRSLNYCERSKTVVVCDPHGRCLVFDEHLSIVLSCQRIPRSAERWLTAFVVLDEQWLLMADRSGHLYLFDRNLVEPVFKLSNVHGKLGITSIGVEDSQKHPQGYRLKTTGHDGRICEIFLDSFDKKLVGLISSKTIISWIDRTASVGSRRFYLGFNDSHFLMADDRNEVLTQFDCGGGHRCWDYHYDGSSDTFTYVFIQHKKLKRLQFTPQHHVGSALSLPRYNWHTRACNVLQVADCEGSRLFISGGEDNILRINTFVGGELMDEPRKHVFNHISSIKTLLVKAQADHDRLIIVSAGGRAQICITSIARKSFLVKQECEYMLRESDSERNRWKTNRRSTFDPETKFTCAAFVGDGQIVFGCSDGFIRIYNLLCADGQWSVVLASESFYGRCVLRVVSVDMSGWSVVLTMATDGFVCFWDPTDINEPFYRHRLHSSGINSVDFKQVDSEKLLLATGGDDQSVTVSLFELKKLDGKPEVTVVYSLCEKYLHTAQVTGVRLIDSGKLISVGVDQRIYVSTFTDKSRLETISSTNTCVADVKGLSLLREDGEIVVYGCGIEILTLPRS